MSIFKLATSKSVGTAVALALVGLAVSSQANATIVNIDATKYGYNSFTLNGGVYTVDLTGANKLQSTFGAGDYTWSNAAGMIGAAYDAFSLAIKDFGTPNASPTRWAWLFEAVDDSTGQILFSSNDVDNYGTEAAAASAAAQKNGTFSLATTTTIDFIVRDYNTGLWDNSKGVSLNIQKATAVPEPEAYAMMLAGLGLIGFAARRKVSV